MSAQGHTIEACYNRGWDDEPDWTVICSCDWEAWSFPSEKSVRCSHAFHVAKDLADHYHSGTRVAADGDT